MADRNRGLQCLGGQAAIENGGDQDELGQKWDLVKTGHHRLWAKLGDRVTEDNPPRLLWQKTLNSSDVSSQQIRLVIHTNAAEGSFFRCLEHQQRQDLDRAAIQVVGFDEQGREWELEWRTRVQSSDSTSVTHVLQGEWGRMLRKNGWRKGTVISIWGIFPYGGMRDKWEFDPEHGFNEFCLVFTCNVKLD